MAAPKLARYQQMRDFQVTQEPSGRGAKPNASSRLRFVIQKHAATAPALRSSARALNGVFKSWAVTRGPSV
jgi:bifunctional non-homologous end joining protein LigD